MTPLEMELEQLAKQAAQLKAMRARPKKSEPEKAVTFWQKVKAKVTRKG